MKLKIKLSIRTIAKINTTKIKSKLYIRRNKYLT